MRQFGVNWGNLTCLRSSLNEGGCPIDIFIGIDKGDPLYDNEKGREELLKFFQKFSPSLERFELPPGRICEIWRSLARSAYRKESISMVVLLGDDLEIKTSNWGWKLWKGFEDLSAQQNTPFGFGVIAFRDDNFVGFPTFPVVHRLHMDIFDGEIFPSCFVNQDADPYLFELYRKWNCSRFCELHLTNSVGGSGDARYTKQPVQWKYETLDEGRACIRKWIDTQKLKIDEFLLLDTITPSYRCNEEYLRRIIDLKTPAKVLKMAIVIVDNPKDENASRIKEAFEKEYKESIWIRILESNQGASAARNRGMYESCADFIVFLDDDVIPGKDLLYQYARAIDDAQRSKEEFGGFVGTTTFPKEPQNFRTIGVRLSGCLYFWDAASRMREMP